MDSERSTKGLASIMKVEVNIREYDGTLDLRRADELEKQCEAGPGGGASLFTDLLGDPLCRVRQYPAFAMLVAETVSERAIVGLVRAGVKKVLRVPQAVERRSNSSDGSSCKSEISMLSDTDAASARNDHLPFFVTIAYILGLRVAPKYRRLGIGAELVKKMEQWCKTKGAEYVYIATEKDNAASVALFTKKLGYIEFRNPAILLQPVYVRCKRLCKKRIRIVELTAEEARNFYRQLSIFGKSEFFPMDIEDVVRSRLHKGTWLAVCKDCFGGYGVTVKETYSKCQNEESMHRFNGVRDSNVHTGSKNEGIHCGRDSQSNAKEERRFIFGPSCTESTSCSSWAIISIWKCNHIYKLQMKGAPLYMRAAGAASRMVGHMLSPLISIPTMPNVFQPFGLQLIYGLHAQGPHGLRLLNQLCWLAHNLAKEEGCAFVAAEVARNDPIRRAIPHWTCDDDMWCIKRLSDSSRSSLDITDWLQAHPVPSLFLDPRDF
ncbi:hypothetical protein KP509_32G005300 [Ceratopteris richardii]|uniref:N-acetyltransferase domain-containing protein n=2 Tax=Ceratopteris richardii TaxID=49495 RepID=A0A8T2QQZ7_CERRI|nr:hypothetical protein KP509_32G005300 [Ceratopteris richardii]